MVWYISQYHAGFLLFLKIIPFLPRIPNVFYYASFFNPVTSCDHDSRQLTFLNHSQYCIFTYMQQLLCLPACQQIWFFFKHWQYSSLNKNMGHIGCPRCFVAYIGVHISERKIFPRNLQICKFRNGIHILSLCN